MGSEALPGVDPFRQHRATLRLLEWQALPWYVRLWEWVRG